MTNIKVDNTKRFQQEMFRAFTVDTDPEVAKQSFRVRFGYEPEICEVHKVLLLVGPIYKEKKNGNVPKDI